MLRIRTYSFLVLTALLLTCCGHSGTNITFHVTELNDSVMLVPKNPRKSPVCEVGIRLTTLQAPAGDRHETVVQAINRYIIDELLPGCRGASVQEAAKRYVGQQMKEFTRQVKDIYYEDLAYMNEDSLHATGDSLDESLIRLAIARYCYDYRIDSHAYIGREDTIVCYQFSSYEYTGGAHGLTTATDLSFSLTDGHVIRPSEIFRTGTQDELCNRLTRKLMQMQKVKTLEQLQELGFLDIAEMFVTNNMLLGKDSITFHYNPYEIAPYVFGDICIAMTYEELSDLLY